MQQPEAWRMDSDMVFTAVSTSAAENFKEAQRMVVLFYVPDVSISRAGISHALGRLEKFYSKTAQSGGQSEDKPLTKVG